MGNDKAFSAERKPHLKFTCPSPEACPQAVPSWRGASNPISPEPPLPSWLLDLCRRPVLHAGACPAVGPLREGGPLLGREGGAGPDVGAGPGFPRQGSSSLRLQGLLASRLPAGRARGGARRVHAQRRSGGPGRSGVGRGREAERGPTQAAAAGSGPYGPGGGWRRKPGGWRRRRDGGGRDRSAARRRLTSPAQQGKVRCARSPAPGPGSQPPPGAGRGCGGRERVRGPERSPRARPARGLGRPARRSGARAGVRGVPGGSRGAGGAAPPWLPPG